ncbi:MAG TPA: M56 family metallopeptidase [Gemmataceae bacterium]|jgi:beta-lactamase regulating signal transducer with metallopeptidase domain|nr:M56 family metallopeptidase [Gemmataceae bacterium]
MISNDSPLVAAAWSQIWQVTALILFVGAIVRVLCKRRNHLAHVLWMLVILKCLTPPLWSSPTSLFSWLQARANESPISESGSPVMRLARYQAPNKSSVNLASDGSQAMDSAFLSSWSMVDVIMVCWLGGVIICGGVVVVRWLQCRRILRRTRAEVDPDLVSFTSGLARRLGIRGHVRIAVTASPHGPAAMGVLSPTILLPAALAGKSPGELEPMLAHELIHIRRGDNLFGVLQLFAQVLWWFHPLVWWVNRNASRAIERCCDEEVVASLGCAPAVYARSLLDVLELKQSLQAVYLAPGMRQAELTAQRLEDIMKRANGFHRRMPMWCWGILAFTVALVLPGKEIIYGPNQAEAETPARHEDATPKQTDAGKNMPEPSLPMLPEKANSVKPALAPDIEATPKQLPPLPMPAAKVIPPNNALAPVVEAAQKQFLTQVIIFEGKPVPTLREAFKQGKIDILSRPQMMTIENQTALVNVGNMVEIPDGAGQKRKVHAGIMLQVTVGLAKDKQVPVKLVFEMSAVNGEVKDRATFNIQHMETTINCSLGKSILTRGVMTDTGKELWIDLRVTEVISRAQATKATLEFGNLFDD